MQEYQWLVNFGFAAVVAMYVLVRIESAIKELTKSVSLLTVIVAQTSRQDIDKAKAQFGGD